MSRAIIGNWRNSGYTFDAGTRIVTMYGVPTKCDSSTITMVELLRASIDYKTIKPIMKVFSINYGNVLPTTPTVAPVAGTPTAGGSITSGLHKYKYSFVINGYETLLSPESNQVDTTTNKTVSVTAPAGVTGTTARNIYRTNAGGTVYYLVGTINDNVAGTAFSDTTADNTTTLAPTTTTCYDFTWIVTVNTNVTTPVTVAGDLFQITIDFQTNTESEELGYGSVAEINPLKQEQDFVVNIATSAPLITTNVWATIGSAYSMQGRNVARHYCTLAVGVATSVYFKIIARHTSAGTAFPCEVVWDKNTRVSEVEDIVGTPSPYARIYRINDLVNQLFFFDVITNGVVAEIEIQFLGLTATVASTTCTLDVIKAWNPNYVKSFADKVFDVKNISNLANPAVLTGLTNVAATTTYYPTNGAGASSVGETILDVKDIQLQMATSGGVTTTVEISQDGTNYVDITALGVNLAGESSSSYVNVTTIVDFNNLNTKYFRVKSVTTGGSSNVLYLIKKRS